MEPDSDRRVLISVIDESLAVQKAIPKGSNLGFEGLDNKFNSFVALSIH